MRLSPLDIRKQEFKRVMRGIDQEEVEAFLSMVADEFEALIREKNQLSDDVLKLRTQLRDYQHVEHTLRETLVSARQSMEESKANSQKEAEMVMREAELKAERIIEDAKEELMELRNEIRLLKSQKDSFIKRLKYLLDSQLELVSTLEIDETDVHEEKRNARSRMRTRISRSQASMESEYRAEENQPLNEPTEANPPQEPKIVQAAEEEPEQPEEAPAFESREFESLDKEPEPSAEEDSEPKDDDERISNQFII